MQTCNGPVDLDSVTIVVDTTTDVVDAMKLGDGCTGRFSVPDSPSGGGPPASHPVNVLNTFPDAC